MDLGPFAAYIWAAYGIVAAVLALMGAWLVVDGRSHRSTLANLEAKGVRRRSERIETEASA